MTARHPILLSALTAALGACGSAAHTARVPAPRPRRVPSHTYVRPQRAPLAGDLAGGLPATHETEDANESGNDVRTASPTDPSLTTDAGRAEPEPVEPHCAAPSPLRPRMKRPLRILRGKASYYHDALSGRPTASGQPYDPCALTAASRTLPLGILLRVRRMDTGHIVVVRVNDRGPFGKKRRLVDLSRAAAEALDMVERGVVRVRIEVLGKQVE